MAPLESASTRRASLPGFVPDDAYGTLRAVPPRGTGGIRASSPAGETRMSEPVGADLPVARDGAGQLSKDALRSPAAGQRAGNLDGDSGFNAGMRLIVDELEIFVLIFRDRRRLAMNGQARQW